MLKSLVLVFTFAVATVSGSAAHHIKTGGPKPITEADLLAAQQSWIDALLAIAETHRSGGDYRTLAGDIIDAAYNYAHAPVLFKPTLTHGEQTFRYTREGALAYFVGGDPNFPNDSGFALKGWVAVEPKTVLAYVEGNTALTMGHFTFTNQDGSTVTVEKTFGYRRDDAGDLRIILHKSTIPFNPGN
ncbi:MAG: hypothetical protein LR015_08440 [Verrucomicrobia bacterium]|nr:hypothetical protein [Verrucomicrobiota bacterium]